MLKKKTSSGEKKRKHSAPEDRQEGRKKRSAEASVEESKDDLADAELDRIGSDIEEGGLDLTVDFQPIIAFVSDKKEMLQQSFRVLGEKKLRKMLPDEFKDFSIDEVQKLCWEQLEDLSEKNLLQVLTGEELTSSTEATQESVESQQDNIVDSTSFPQDVAKSEETKEVSSEESDVLSINADVDDSDIEAPKVEPSVKTTDAASNQVSANKESDPARPAPVSEQPLAVAPSHKPKKDIQSDIDKSVSEILAFSVAASPPPPPPSLPLSLPPPSVDQTPETSAVQSAPASVPGAVCQPSIQQLELLELEMRARAIKALMKAGKSTTN
ncbi:unnamed protein product [Knipowitschia caucasica]